MSEESGMKFACPHCSQSLEAEPDMAGDVIDCPTCGKAITIPTPPQAKPRLALRVDSLRTQTTRQQSRVCPSCRAVLPPDAVICVQCGYDTRTGRKVTEVKANRPFVRSGVGIGVGVVALVAILIIGLLLPHRTRSILSAPAGTSAAQSAARSDSNPSTPASSESTVAAGGTRQATENMRAAMQKAGEQKYLIVAMKILVDAIEANPKADNIAAARQQLDEYRSQYASARDRIKLLDAQIEAAKAAKTYTEGIEILEKAIAEFPGLPNTDSATALLESYRVELGQAQQLSQVIDEAKQQRYYQQAIGILETGLRDYPRAGNRNDAIALLNQYKRELQGAVAQEQRRQQYVSTGAIGGGAYRFKDYQAAWSFADQLSRNNSGSMDALREQSMMGGGGTVIGSATLLQRYRVVADRQNPGYWLVVPFTRDQNVPLYDAVDDTLWSR